MPRMQIFKMFGRSPIRPLQRHMKAVHECVSELGPFFTEVLKENWKEATELRRGIAKLENEADDIKRDLCLHLPKGIFMPVQRSDVLELITRQDLVANKAKDIAGLVLGRKMHFPGDMPQKYLEFLKRNIDAVEQAYETISELDKLFEAGFSGQEVVVIEEMIHKLLKIERDTDKMEIALRREIFSIESELPPVDVMFLYQLLEWTGDLANRAQRVGDSMQFLIAR